MTKVLGGLHRQPTFEQLIESGDTYDFTDNIRIYSSAALNLRQGFFAPPLGNPDVVDAGHDEKHEAVLAAMKAIALAQEQRQDTRRENDRAMFAAVLGAHRQNMAEHVVGPQGPPPGGPPPGGPQQPRPQDFPSHQTFDGKAKSWQEREQLRKEQYKPADTSQRNGERQNAARKAERAKELNNKRAEATAERYDIDRSPSPGPSSQMQERYDDRIRQRSTPLTTRIQSARAGSVARGRQAATNSQREGRSQVITQRRSRALIPAASAPSLGEMSRGRSSNRNSTPPPRARRGNVGPLAITPGYQ